jgi:8-oxo-dGTP diphosphatase
MDLIGAVAVIEKAGRTLLIKQGSDKPLTGMWRHPGGKIQENETPIECLKREIREELGLEIEVIDKEPEFVMESEYDSGMFGFFRARVKSGKLSIEEREIDQAAWFRREEIMELDLMKATRYFYSKLVDK